MASPDLQEAASPLRILVVGASGYVGGRLASRLLERGHVVRLASRDPRGLAERFPGADVASIDLLAPRTLPRALKGIDTTYYLAHSMAGGEAGFVERDLAAARNFGRAASAAGVRHIVYLGGLGDPSSNLSPHLASRQQVGKELAAHGIAVTEFRAAIIIGSGSASFEILRNLIEHLPFMLTPRRVRTRCQPIGIRDVLDYLLAAAGHPERHGIVEIGGPDVLTYEEMMATYARLRGMRRFLFPIPILSPRLSSYWVNFVTPVPASIARPLIDGLQNEAVVRDPGPAAAFGIVGTPFETAVQRAIDRTIGSDLETTWFDSVGVPGRPSFDEGGSREGVVFDRQRVHVAAPVSRTWAEVERLGGVSGWPYANMLWRIRGLLDRVAGGPGMRLGRRDPSRLRVGDALDFWRVEAVQRPTLLRLRAEMRVPGGAWLQYEVVKEGSGTQLCQTAFFEPKGLSGRAYWYLLLPIHKLVFMGTVHALARGAARRAKRDRSGA